MILSRFSFIKDITRKSCYCRLFHFQFASRWCELKDMKVSLYFQIQSQLYLGDFKLFTKARGIQTLDTIHCIQACRQCLTFFDLKRKNGTPLVRWSINRKDQIQNLIKKDLRWRSTCSLKPRNDDFFYLLYNKKCKHFIFGLSCQW